MYQWIIETCNLKTKKRVVLSFCKRQNQSENNCSNKLNSSLRRRRFSSLILLPFVTKRSISILPGISIGTTFATVGATKPYSSSAGNMRMDIFQHSSSFLKGSTNIHSQQTIGSSKWVPCFVFPSTSTTSGSRQYHHDSQHKRHQPQLQVQQQRLGSNSLMNSLPLFSWVATPLSPSKRLNRHPIYSFLTTTRLSSSNGVNNNDNEKQMKGTGKKRQQAAKDNKKNKKSNKNKQVEDDNDEMLVDENERKLIIEQEEKEEYKENLAIGEYTKEWVKKIIVGLNLCPFAEKPLKTNKLKIEVVRNNNMEEIISFIYAEILIRKQKEGTTLIVCPECYPDDFLSFLDVVAFIEQDLIIENDLQEYIQVVPFHPLFQFEKGSSSSAAAAVSSSDVVEEEDTADNWTNRSPYPMFHILREEEVSKAVDILDSDSGKVWKRNVKLLHEIDNAIGRKKLEHYFMKKTTPTTTTDDDDDGQEQVLESDKTKIKQILRNNKIKFSSTISDDDDDDDKK